MDYSIRIGGEAGQGIQTIGDSLVKIFAGSGYHVFSHQDYESRIRGGHNFFQIRLSDRPISASREKIDILIALDRETISRHASRLSENGLVVYDSAGLKEKREEPHFFDVPFASLAEQHGGSKIMANAAAVGAVLGMLAMDLAAFLDIIKGTFQKKGDETVQANSRAAIAGHEFAVKNCRLCSFRPGAKSSPKMLLNGVEAIGLGALSAGCKFYAAYPMTPSTGIMLFLADRAKEYGVIVEQAEDEIAAINMALGASFAGVRAMTGTSGGGFALMVEGLALAGMTETPVVIALGQRPGPATGFPTRTEQGELLFALHAGHGEFPRVLFAPGTPEQAFHLTNKAFDLAEKFQIPAFVLFDQYLADTQWSYDGIDLKKVKYTDYRLRGNAFKSLSEYKRHAWTETGVSPLGVPGDSRHVVVTDSDEHGEEGHIVEDAETRVKMVEKRFLKKLPLLKREMEPPTFYGETNPEIVIVGWGSTYGIMKEAVDGLSKTKSVSLLHFAEVYPLPPVDKFDYLKVLEKAKLAVAVEQNASGQFANLLQAETGYRIKAHIRRFDGRPFMVEELRGELYGHIG